MAKASKRPKPSEMSKLKKRLEELQKSIAEAEKDSTKTKLALQILKTEALIERENIHQLSGYNRIGYHEISSGAPGLGKRK